MAEDPKASAVGEKLPLLQLSFDLLHRSPARYQQLRHFTASEIQHLMRQEST
jgi:hypothetical protein